MAQECGRFLTFRVPQDAPGSYPVRKTCKKRVTQRHVLVSLSSDAVGVDTMTFETTSEAATDWFCEHLAE